MQSIQLNQKVRLSRICAGMWHIDRWNFSVQMLDTYIRTALELGITSFDHADIYGDYENERQFGLVLKESSSLRNNIRIVTKCGIVPITKKYPERTVKIYDTSAEYIRKSVENSLKNFQTDYIDLLLLHRPDPLAQPEEIGSIIEQLYNEGKILSFGVSNYSPSQIDLIQASSKLKISVNQIEFSPLHSQALTDGNLDYLLQHKITPMAWSPFASGKLFDDSNPQASRIKQILRNLDYGNKGQDDDILALAWILRHPSGIIPVIGTSKTERLKRLASACDIDLSRADWFAVYQAILGNPVP